MLRVLAVGFVVWLGCVVGFIPRTYAAASVPFEVLLARSGSACPHVRTLTWARTPQEFQDLWQQACRGEPAPDVDFQHSMVVAYFMGFWPNTGAHPEVTGVYRARGEMRVAVTDFISGGGFDMPTDWQVFIVTHKWPGPVVLDRTVQYQ